MKQLDLLPIPRQPAPKEIAIKSRTVRAYVRQNLRGLMARQAERVAKRKEQQERYEVNRQKAKSTGPKQECTHQNMRQIKVTYRAVFEQPIGPLNPMGMKIPGPQPVELFGKNENWQAREITTAHRHIFKKLGKFVSLAHAKNEVALAFKTKLQDWQIWGIPPEPASNTERMLLPEEIHICTEGVYWLQAEDFTHILHAPTIPPGAKIPPAACGQQVNTKCFISTKANIEPTCKACAEVWRKEYKGK